MKQSIWFFGEFSPLWCGRAAPYIYLVLGLIGSIFDVEEIEQGSLDEVKRNPG
ncbi:MAG: hypothetical protein ABW104_20765 [Candidatus Thiodiazotropha sp. 6PLUC2]